ncbi:MAG: hypothetical protein ABIA37_00520 [Candidatus Woesearchaeota archaeon]
MIKMGLFSRKKKMEVPSPPSDSLLRFPKPPQREIHPEEIKQAVKMERSPEIKPKVILPPMEKPVTERPMPSPKPQMPRIPFPLAQGPFFLRIQNHQMLMEHMEKIKTRLGELDQTSRDLEKSEFNEHQNYEEFKEELKKIHDRLIFIEGVVFKR